MSDKSDQPPHESKRFTPSHWTDWGVPALIALLGFVLLVVLVLLGLAIFGII